jgi:hypothetical protein
MSRGVQLGQMIEDLRSEVGHSLQASLGKQTRDVLINTLQRHQKRLWEDYAWPFLQVRRDIAMADAQRYYDLPSDMTFERIQFAEFKWGDRWDRMSYGIGLVELNQYDSDRNQKSWPIMRYEAYENNQFEVWPIPNDNGNATTKSGYVRFHGTKNLSNFIAETDTADLDDQLIILFAAAEILQRQKQGDAQMKMGQAQQHYMRLKARSAKSDSFVISSGEGQDPYIPKGPPVIAVMQSS